MDYDEDKIRRMVLNGLKNPDPWRVELEPINFGDRLGVFYTPTDGVIKRESVDTKGKSDEQIAFGLLLALRDPVMVMATLKEIEDENAAPPQPSMLQKAMDGIRSLYEGKRGKHPNNCTCSKHLGANGA